MKKPSLIAFLSCLLVGITQAGHTPSGNPDKINTKKEGVRSATRSLKTYPGDVYFFLFDDGCYHLGREVAYPDGSIWWVPIYGFPLDGYVGTTVICMDRDVWQNFC